MRFTIGVIAILALLTTAAALAGCGSYSQARVDEYQQFKRNHVQDVERARDDMLSPVELRNSLESIDKAILAEHGLKGSEADLETVRVELRDASDNLVADLFDGDNGRTSPETGSGPSPPDGE